MEKQITETEKAVLIQENENTIFWIPKSQISDGSISDWFRSKIKKIYVRKSELEAYRNTDYSYEKFKAIQARTELRELIEQVEEAADDSTLWDVYDLFNSDSIDEEISIMSESEATGKIAEVESYK